MPVSVGAPAAAIADLQEKKRDGEEQTDEQKGMWMRRAYCSSPSILPNTPSYKGIPQMWRRRKKKKNKRRKPSTRAPQSQKKVCRHFSSRFATTTKPWGGGPWAKAFLSWPARWPSIPPPSTASRLPAACARAAHARAFFTHKKKTLLLT